MQPKAGLVAVALVVACACHAPDRGQAEAQTERHPMDDTPPASGAVLPAPLAAADLRPPPDAMIFVSRLASKVVRPSSAAEHPGPRDIAMVRISGWADDGAPVLASPSL